jgi:hypothetical protein
MRIFAEARELHSEKPLSSMAWKPLQSWGSDESFSSQATQALQTFPLRVDDMQMCFTPGSPGLDSLHCDSFTGEKTSSEQ